MINPIMVITPTIIFITCLFVFVGLRKESRKYIAEMRQLSEDQTRIMNVIFLKKIIRFFVESKTSRDTEQLLDNMENFTERIEEGASNIASDATKEIAELHNYLDRITRKQKNLVSLQALTSIMTNTVLAYGIIVAAMQYTILTLYIIVPSFAPIKQIDDIMIGATLIFGAVIILFYVDIVRLARRVKNLKYSDHELVKTADNEPGINSLNPAR
ncbi:MAG: hypothetical protein AMDU5_GPLC00016G0015 [Thermoplasmatales archaeon Gpl]|jgi:hypothetical protein|nr:MAG: hypothetical protein AMDU5_GPLC00016G0015 [Thermoplasmatales archaeon Gpl]WMT45356.1 MAG: hypothetical protein RE469_03975 [Cuniculiplasma divulgatum]